MNEADPVQESVASSSQTHAEWWNSDAPSEVGDAVINPGAAERYTDSHAANSLRRAGMLVLLLTGLLVPVAGFFQGWRGALALVVGAAISGSGLWEWRRLMTALTARMDAVPTLLGEVDAARARVPSIGFAIAGFMVRLFVVMIVLYVSLSYLHGSVPALAAGLAMGVLALTAEAIRLLRRGII